MTIKFNLYNITYTEILLGKKEKDNFMKKVLSLLLVAGLSLVYAGKTPTPDAAYAKSAHGITLVDAKEAKAMVDNGAAIVDCRGKISYSRERIKGALLTSYKEKGGKKNRHVGWDMSKEKWKDGKIQHLKDKKVIFYCNGVKCWKSYKCAVAATKNGYNHVYWLRSGIGGWKNAGFPIE